MAADHLLTTNTTSDPGGLCPVCVQTAGRDGCGSGCGDWLWLDVPSWGIRSLRHDNHLPGDHHTLEILLQDTTGDQDSHLPLLFNIYVSG